MRGLARLLGMVCNQDLHIYVRMYILPSTLLQRQKDPDPKLVYATIHS